MIQVTLISSEQIKANSVILENVDDKTIRICTLKAQNYYLRSKIGELLLEDLYKAVIDYKDNNTPIPLEYETLINDYLQLAIVEYTVSLCIDTLAFKYSNQGVEKIGDEKSTPADLDEIKYNKQQPFKSAEFYSQRAIRFIKNNKEDYPLYFECEDNFIKPANKGYNSGLYLDK